MPKKKMPSAPIKAPVGTVKGIGRMGQTVGGLKPSVINPGSGKRGMALIGQILGPQGGKK